jgi:RNA polymerase sigma factor (sigma-70 family)
LVRVDYRGESSRSENPNGVMKTAKSSELVVQLVPRPVLSSAPDADLLGRFLADRDDEAFALLVRRHGPQVLGVCRRVTGDHHLAEDAFQAVFVVLAAKAGSIRPPSGLPAWLFGVAYRIALRARTMRDRRLRHEKPVAPLPEPTSSASRAAEDTDLVAALDEEIARLPESQRVPVVVCELERASRQEAAARLGISEGTLSSRLARARRAFADRLRRRGIALSAAGLIAALAQLAPASVPGRLVSTAVARATGPGLVPATVAALSHGVLRVMFVQKLKVLVVASGLLASALFAAYRLTAGDPPTAPEATPARSAEPILRFATQPQPKGATEEQGPNKLLVVRAGHLVLIDPDGTNEKKLTQERLPFYRDARLSPDGKTVALIVQPKVPGAGQEIRLDRPQKLFIRTLDEKGAGVDLDAECKMFAWSPDGSEIACNQFAERPTEQEVTAPTHFVVNVKTKKKTPPKLPDYNFVNDLSRDGKYFLTARFSANKDQPQTRQTRLYLMNRDGTEHKVLTAEGQFCIDGRLSPDGKRVLYILVTPAKDGKEPTAALTVLDIATGKSAAVSDVPSASEIRGFSWAPDGKRIAYTWREVREGKPEEVEKKEANSHLVVCDADGKNAKTIATEKGTGSEVTIGRVDWR